VRNKHGASDAHDFDSAGRNFFAELGKSETESVRGVALTME
jgi:hypothetical protein